MDRNQFRFSNPGYFSRVQVSDLLIDSYVFELFAEHQRFLFLNKVLSDLKVIFLFIVLYNFQLVSLQLRSCFNFYGKISYLCW